VRGQTIWCIGVYASASTWLFNVVRLLLLAAGNGPVKTHFFAGAGDFSAFDQPGTINIVKSHDINDAATIEALTKRAGQIFVTVRDPRDAVCSLIVYHAYDFERGLKFVDAAARLCWKFASDPRTMLMMYESGFVGALGTIPRIAAHLGLNVPPVSVQAIYDKMQRSEVEKYISEMSSKPGILRDRLSGDLLDPVTH